MRIRPDQRFIAIVLWVVVLVTAGSSQSVAATAGGSAITLGSSLSFGVIMPDAGDNLTYFAAPDGAQLFFGATPGLRLGHVSADRELELGFDTSMLFLHADESNGHMLVFGADIQKHFSTEGQWNLFLGGDIGVLLASDIFADATSPYFGVMFGGRNIISDDNGSLKLAAHFRHHMEDEDSGLDSFNELALALHFDLWMPK